jgi:hypothetical protein
LWVQLAIDNVYGASVASVSALASTTATAAVSAVTSAVSVSAVGTTAVTISTVSAIASVSTISAISAVAAVTTSACDKYGASEFSDIDVCGKCVGSIAAVRSIDARAATTSGCTGRPVVAARLPVAAGITAGDTRLSGSAVLAVFSATARLADNRKVRRLLPFGHRFGDKICNFVNFHSVLPKSFR